MPITGLQHVSITVSNLDRSVEFYSDVLGLYYLGTQWMPSDQVYEIYKLQGVSLRYGWLRTARDGVIELLEFQPPDKTDFEFLPSRCGPNHFALQVQDLTKLYKELTEKGVEGLVPPKTIQGKIKVAFIKDPDGIPIELVDLGVYMTPKLRFFGRVIGLFNRYKRRRAEQMAPGACRETNDK
jgi:catechol 2,3-dioxygenase-like lactoylglutathione lyase family enzyme